MSAPKRLEYHDKEVISGLVIRAQQGDQRAMHELIASTKRSLDRFCFFLTRDDALCEEICQQAFIKMLDRLCDLRDPNQFINWLFQIARYCYLDYLKSPWVKRGEQLPGGDEGNASGIAQDDLLVIQSVLNQLDEEDRALFILICAEDYTYKEAGEALGISEHLVKWRLKRIRGVIERVGK